MGFHSWRVCLAAVTSLAVVAAGEAGSDGTAGRVVKDGGWAVPAGAEVCLWRRRGRGKGGEAGRAPTMPVAWRQARHMRCGWKAAQQQQQQQSARFAGTRRRHPPALMAPATDLPYQPVQACMVRRFLGRQVQITAGRRCSRSNAQHNCRFRHAPTAMHLLSVSAPLRCSTSAWAAFGAALLRMRMRLCEHCLRLVSEERMDARWSEVSVVREKRVVARTREDPQPLDRLAR